MNSTTQNITVEFCGVEMDATVNVYYEPGESRITNKDPDSCREGSDEYWELTGLHGMYNKDNLTIRKHVDLSGLLNVPDIYESILNQVKELMIDESKDDADERASEDRAEQEADIYGY